MCVQKSQDSALLARQLLIQRELRGFREFERKRRCAVIGDFVMECHALDDAGSRADPHAGAFAPACRAFAQSRNGRV
jgi:hypothetical protein